MCKPKTVGRFSCEEKKGEGGRASATPTSRKPRRPPEFFSPPASSFPLLRPDAFGTWRRAAQCAAWVGGRRLGEGRDPSAPDCSRSGGAAFWFLAPRRRLSNAPLPPLSPAQSFTHPVMRVPAGQAGRGGGRNPRAGDPHERAPTRRPVLRHSACSPRPRPHTLTLPQFTLSPLNSSRPSPPTGAPPWRRPPLAPRARPCAPRPWPTASACACPTCRPPPGRAAPTSAKGAGTPLAR